MKISEQQVKNMLLSLDKAGHKSQQLHQQKFVYPYIIEISKPQQCLYFLGIKHRFDPDEPQFTITDNYWRKFLEITNSQNCIVLNEGGKRPDYSSRVAAINNGGESAYLCYLARQSGIPDVSPEPDRTDEMNYLLQQFSLDEILYYYFSRQANQWCDALDKPSFKNYVQATLDRHHKLGWKEYDFSYNHMASIYQQKHHRPINEARQADWYYDSAPRTNPVAAKCSNFRNIYIMMQIKKLWDDGKNIFAAFGSHHAFVLEPALKKLLT